MPLQRQHSALSEVSSHVVSPVSEALRDQLRHPDAALRRDAAQAARGDAGATGWLLEALSTESEPTVRSALLASLREVPSAAVVEGLLPHLQGEDVALRNAVVELLQEMPHEIAPSLSAQLQHPDPDVRILSVNILSALALPEAPALLVEVLEREAHINVLGTALDALVEIGGPESAEAIRGVILRFPAEPFLCFAAETALKRIEG